MNILITGAAGFVGKNLSEESKKDSSLDSILGREQTSVPQTVGSAAAGEDSRTAIARELREETGIDVPKESFELLDSQRDKNTFYDFYCLKHPVPLSQIVLQPGETDDCMWASFGKIHWMIRRKKICRIIARQFYRQEKMLRLRNMPKIKDVFLGGNR